MSQTEESGPIFFASAADFRAWLEAHHASAQELWVGYYKKSSGMTGVSYPETVDEALCFGWIDGIRKSIDKTRYMNRFTPRRKGSNWSAVNIRRVQELTAEGRMTPAGLRAFEAREQAKTGVYSYEQENPIFDPDVQAQFEANPQAWGFFQSQPPSYRRAATNYVMSAKRDETRQKRLATLIEDSAAGRRLAIMARPSKASQTGSEG